MKVQIDEIPSAQAASYVLPELNIDLGVVDLLTGFVGRDDLGFGLAIDQRHDACDEFSIEIVVGGIGLELAPEFGRPGLELLLVEHRNLDQGLVESTDAHLVE